MSENICAIIVTFNRKELLVNCINALLQQSRPLDAIFIIDNFSSDGTSEKLLEKEFIDKLPAEKLSKNFEHTKVYNYEVPLGFLDDGVEQKKTKYRKSVEINYVKMSENTGGAGGFHEGLKRGHEAGYDWIWLMDDDGYPAPNCLQQLLNDTMQNKLKVINPLVINTDDKNKLSFGLENGIKDVQTAKNSANNNGLLYGCANPFNGTFINKSVVDKIGYVKKEMFIWGDETEYFERIRENRFDFATSVNALFFHPKLKGEQIKFAFGLFHILKKPSNLEMNFYRNQAYIQNKYKKAGRFKFFIKHVIYFVSTLQIKKLISFIKYYWDGKTGRYLLPVFYN